MTNTSPRLRTRIETSGQLRGARTLVMTILLVAGALVALGPAATPRAQAAGPDSGTTSSAAQRITVGGAHSCTLDSGLVRCWGDNGPGKLGYGHTQDIGDGEHPASAGTVQLGGVATAIAAGSGHTCALLNDGAVRCWGSSFGGALGSEVTQHIGDNETPASVAPVLLGRSAIAIAAGANHTCAILDDGNISCWGLGTSGRLGYGNEESIGDDESPLSAGTVDLGPHREATSIAAGDRHTCAILDDGSVRCWGSGSYGRLGYGNQDTIGDDETPARVGPVNLGTNAKAVSIDAGYRHTCAALADGTVRCWGESDKGRLGAGISGDIGDNETPASKPRVPVPGFVTSVSVGFEHTCARLSDGTVRCWGASDSGRLGYPDRHSDIGGIDSVANTGPVQLGGAVTALDAGSSHTCVRLATGDVRCWGFGSFGRLGYANVRTVGDDETPAAAGPVVLGTRPQVVAIGAGNAHTCALINNGTARCWGSSAHGELGYGNTQTIGDNELPSSAGPVDLGALATAISVGAQHTCALLDDGTVSCWGAATSGRLGYGNLQTIGDNETPASVGRVDLGRAAVAITAGTGHSCAILDNGTVRCWGFGGDGRLGYGDTRSIGDNESPVQAGPALNFGPGRRAVSISAGKRHTCAVMDDGTVRCWGWGMDGQLGYGNHSALGDNESLAAIGSVPLGAGREARSIAAGDAHTCVELDNGQVKCWGLGNHGRLGYASLLSVGLLNTPADVDPVEVGGLVTGIVAGGTGTCGLLSNGSLRCWGFGGLGSLGYGNSESIGDDEAPAASGPVDLGGRALAITQGQHHTCAVLQDDVVRCWGLGNDGRLGHSNFEIVGDDEHPAAAPVVNVL